VEQINPWPDYPSDEADRSMFHAYNTLWSHRVPKLQEHWSDHGAKVKMFLEGVERQLTIKPVWRGGGRVQIGDETITLEPQFSEVLEALVELRSATKPQLQKRSGRPEADKLLKKLVERFPILTPYIQSPGRRGKGGYSTTITNGAN
jgi:hypothetical protein